MKKRGYGFTTLKVGEYIDIMRPPPCILSTVAKSGQRLGRKFATRVVESGARRVMRVE
jgi:hypothetical protein